MQQINTSDTHYESLLYSLRISLPASHRQPIADPRFSPKCMKLISAPAVGYFGNMPAVRTEQNSIPVEPFNSSLQRAGDSDGRLPRAAAPVLQVPPPAPTAQGCDIALAGRYLPQRPERSFGFIGAGRKQGIPVFRTDRDVELMQWKR